MSFEEMGGGLTAPSLIDEVSVTEHGDNYAEERAHVDVDYDDEYGFPGTGREQPMPRATTPEDVQTDLTTFGELHHKDAVDVRQTADRWRCGTVQATYVVGMNRIVVSDKDHKRLSLTVRNPLLPAPYASVMLVGFSPTMPDVIGAGVIPLYPGESQTFYHTEAVYCMPMAVAAPALTYLAWSIERTP